MVKTEAKEIVVDAEGVTRYGEHAHAAWCRTVLATCQAVLQDAFTSLESSTRTYRAVACAEAQLSLCLKHLRSHSILMEASPHG